MNPNSHKIEVLDDLICVITSENRVQEKANSSNFSQLLDGIYDRKINLFTLLGYCSHMDKSILSTPLDMCANIFFFPLAPIILFNKLHFSLLVQNKIFLFTKNFNLIGVIDIKDLKKIAMSGQFSLKLKFFPHPLNDENRVLLIKTLSTIQRDAIVMSILPEGSMYHQDINFKKKLLLQIFRERRWFFNEAFNKAETILRECNLLMHNDIYDLFKDFKRIISDSKNKHRAFFEFKSLVFISSIGLVQTVLQNLFYNIKKVKFDTGDIEEMYHHVLMNFRTHRDSIHVEKGRRRINHRKRSSNLLKKGSKSKTIKLKENRENSIKSNEEDSNNPLSNNLESETKSNISEEFMLKGRPRYNKGDLHSKTNYIKHKMASIEGDVLTKPLYDKIIFNVTIPKYFGKEQKVLEINNSGYFMIYKRGKNDNFLSYMIDDIVQMEGENSTNALNITTVVKELKKVTWLEFNNAYEKYVFKTIVYNHLLLSMPRYRMGNQLKLNVNVMTWNLAGIDVPADLGVMFNTQAFEGIDVFTIGVQECSIFKIKDWQKHLKTLISYYGYEDVTSIDMCQMFLIVFVKKDLRPFVENVCSSYKPMGFAKIIGNKGGIIISFRLMGYQLTFVNCHLAPKPYKVLERNKHAKNLVKSIRIGEKFADFDILADYLFWQGDLNYRIDYTFDETVREIQKNNIKHLLTKDQLLRQKQLNQVFYNFQEPEINFFPTYRRIRGMDEYSNKNNQSPSWCDRVMVKTARDLDMLFYDSIKNVKHSDHMPVLGKFSIYLTIPSFDDIEKTLNQNVAGQFVYTNLCLNYDFTEVFSELEIEPKFPFKLKLSSHYFLHKQNADTKYIEIKDYNQLENIYFDKMILNFPPQFIFDLPHSRALNIFFILTLQMGKYSYEIGFAKYSLENVEKENLPLLIHDQKLEMTWRLRKFGMLSLTSSYKF